MVILQEIKNTNHTFLNGNHMRPPPIYTEILVCYDVKSDKKRTQLANALKNIGLINVQHSVFWGYATSAERKSILTLFPKILDSKTDKAFILPGKTREHILQGFGYTEQNIPEYSDYAIL